MTGKRGNLKFTTDCSPGTRIVIYAQLTAAPWVGDHAVTMYVGGKPRKLRNTPKPSVGTRIAEPVPIRADMNHFCTVSGEVGNDGIIEVRIDVFGPDVKEHPKKGADDERVFFIGLRKLAYAPAANLELRADLFESFNRVN